MVFINSNLLIAKCFIISVLIATSWIGFSQLASASMVDQTLIIDIFVVSEIFIKPKIEESLDLKRWDLEYWQENPEFTLNRKQLLVLSKRLRDVARYLGAKWSLSIPLTEELIITDFKDTDGKWVSLTAGQTLRLVTQELQILEASGEQPFIQFLVMDRAKDVYHPLSNVPLSRYCYELLENSKS